MKLLTLVSVTLCFMFPLVFSQFPTEVLDSYGGPIFQGLRYFFKPRVPKFIIGKGRGVILSKTTNSTCPVTILQSLSNATDGLQVKFTIQGYSIGYIFEGTPLDFDFIEEKPECASSSRWVAVVDKDFTWIGIGGAQDHAGKKVVNGTFKVQICDGYKTGYKLNFCFDRYDDSTCSNVTTLDDGNNGRRLVLSRTAAPYRLQFTPAIF